MASQLNPKQLVEELSKNKLEVSKLKDSLNRLDEEKESWFRKKEECSRKIVGSIQRIKENKAKRDSSTREVKELKSKRDSLNAGISAKLKKFDDIKKEKASLVKSLNLKESPSRIKQDIEKLEFRIETEPMPFDKEQAAMKKIKELKKIYGNASVLIEIDKNLRDASDEISKMKKAANDAHKSIQEKAGQSQAMHEEMLKLSAEIDKMKIEDEDAFRKFSELKQKFNETNSQLKERLKAMNSVREYLDKIGFERKEKRRQEQESFLKSKEEEVNRKIKRGEKITTEDLLVFQKSEKI